MTKGGVVTRPLPEQPFCTIVIPCYDEEAFIESAVRGAMRQRYPADRMEILVVDGRSTDKTRSIVAALALEDPRVRLLDNPARIQSAGMNLAIAQARGDVICRMDAHADYAEDYLAASVAVLRRTGALNAGGAARPRHRTPFQRALCAALSSPLGFGGSAYRDPSREGFVESVFNGAFRREAFEIAGLYDPEAVTNEDADLNQRIIEAGGRVYLSRDIVVHYYPRGSLGALARQYFAYGLGRARTLAKHRRLLSPRPVVPFATVVTLGLLAIGAAFVPLVRPLFALALVAYLGAVAIESVRVASRAGASVLPTLLAIFPAMHVSHGLGFGVGIGRFFFGAGQPPREAVRLPAR